MSEEIAVNGADWLAQWDSGEAVWSIEMGGIGPGYEQAIQITTSEILRHLINSGAVLPTKEDPEVEHKWRQMEKTISSAVIPRIQGYGISGAQWGAAMNLATKIYRRGTVALDDPEVKDRRILVSKSFPHVADAP